MSTSLRGEIQSGLVSRLESITAANGYETDVVKVFADEIPMGLSLDDYELPAILVIAGDDEMEYKTQWIHGTWGFELQLIHRLVPDSVMNCFARDVIKSISANSPTAARNEAWRGPFPEGIHESVYDFRVQNIESDLGMIEANRFFCVNIMIRYQTRPHNL